MVNKSILKGQDDKQWSTNQSEKDKTTSNGQQINPKRTRRQVMVNNPKRTRRQAMVNKSLHRKLNIDQKATIIRFSK
jgi:hypothetical protein